MRLWWCGIALPKLHRRRSVG